MGRQSTQPGVRLDKVSSTKRGFANVSVTEKDGHQTKTRLLSWCAENGQESPDAGVNALLDLAERGLPVVPWARIRAALVAALPNVKEEAIDGALHTAGMPTKEGEAE